MEVGIHGASGQIRLWRMEIYHGGGVKYRAWFCGNTCPQFVLISIPLKR